MAARIDNRRVQLLTRTGLDWTSKYPSAAAALANLNIKTAYVDGELCGVDEAGLPSFANTQAATEGEGGSARLLRLRSHASRRMGRGRTPRCDLAPLAASPARSLLPPFNADRQLPRQGGRCGAGQVVWRRRWDSNPR
jgi:hypothetical protein